MAAFNPEVPSLGIPDFSGASRGTGPNRAFEALFTGVGEVTQGAATVVDNSIKTGIKDEVRGGVEALNAPIDSVPPELQNSTSGMQALQTAYEQGKISDTYYYGQLNTQLKGLRTKYPGYEDFIDETMQSITGVRPANAFRNALLGEIADLQNSASDTEKSWRTWENQNDAEISRLFPDYFENPGKYDRDQVRSQVAALKGNEAGITAENARLNLLANQDKVNEEDASEVATTALIQQANTFLSGQSNLLGFDSKDFMDKVSAGLVDGFSEEEFGALTSQMTIAESQLRQNLLRTMNAPLEEGSSNSYASIIGIEQTNKLVDEAMAQFNTIKEMVANKDFGMAGYYTRLNGLRQQRDTATILDASPELRLSNALAEIDPALAEVILRESGGQDKVTAMVPELLSRMLGDQDSFNAIVDRIDTSRLTGDEKATAVNSAIDGAVAIITSGNATPEQLTQAVNSIYAKDEDGRDLFSIVTPNEYSALYSRMFNPSITQALVANGDQKTLRQYYDAAVERMQAVPDFRRAAAGVQDRVDWSKGITVQFDPNTGRLGVIGDINKSGFTPGNIGAETAFNGVVRSANEAVNGLNNVMSLLNPMLDGMGVDPEMKHQIILEHIKGLGVNLENGKQDGMFDWIAKQVQNEIDIFNNSDMTKGVKGLVNDFVLPEIQNQLQNTSDQLFGQMTPEEQASIQNDFKFDFIQEQAAQGIQYDSEMAKGIEFELDGKIRNKPTSDFWNSTVSAILDDMPRGVRVVVTSGGQDRTGPNRTGSHRHDVNEHGEADTADVVLTKNGKRVTPKQEPELYADFLRRAAKMGFEGIGHYDWGVHIGMGSRAAWGPSTTSRDLDPTFASAIQEGWSLRPGGG